MNCIVLLGNKLLICVLFFIDLGALDTHIGIYEGEKISSVPFNDFTTYALRILFPGEIDHPILHPPEVYTERTQARSDHDPKAVGDLAQIQCNRDGSGYGRILSGRFRLKFKHVGKTRLSARVFRKSSSNYRRAYLILCLNIHLRS